MMFAAQIHEYLFNPILKYALKMFAFLLRYALLT